MLGKFDAAVRVADLVVNYLPAPPNKGILLRGFF
jgi:hypothetical protein